MESAPPALSLERTGSVFTNLTGQVLRRWGRPWDLHLGASLGRYGTGLRDKVCLGFWRLTVWEDFSIRDSAERLKTATKSLTLKPK